MGKEVKSKAKCKKTKKKMVEEKKGKKDLKKRFPIFFTVVMSTIVDLFISLKLNYLFPVQTIKHKFIFFCFIKKAINQQ